MESLTSLRFFAAALVLITHTYMLYAPAPALSAVAPFGGSGVYFFFVLSGFVLAWSWRPGDSVPDFYWRRVARIWPLHLVVLVPAMLSIAAYANAPLDRRAGTLSLVLLQAWSPEIRYHWGGNPVAWSLSCEAFFYALFPLVVTRAARLSRRALGAATAGTIALMAAGELLAHAVLPDASATYVLITSPYYRVTQFLLGVLLALLVRRGVVPRVPVIPAVGLVAVHPLLYWATSAFPAQLSPVMQFYIAHGRWVMLPVSYAVLILAVARRDLTGRPSLLRSRRWSCSGTGPTRSTWST